MNCILCSKKMTQEIYEEEDQIKYGPDCWCTIQLLSYGRSSGQLEHYLYRLADKDLSVWSLLATRKKLSGETKITKVNLEGRNNPEMIFTFDKFMDLPINPSYNDVLQILSRIRRLSIYQ